MSQRFLKIKNFKNIGITKEEDQWQRLYLNNSLDKDKIVYIFEFFIHFSKIYYKKANFLVFLIHEYHCMILVVCYNINKKLKTP